MSRETECGLLEGTECKALGTFGVAANAIFSNFHIHLTIFLKHGFHKLYGVLKSDFNSQIYATCFYVSSYSAQILTTQLVSYVRPLVGNA